LIVWALAQNCGDGHRSLVTPERVLSEHNEDLFFFHRMNVTTVISPTLIEDF